MAKNSKSSSGKGKQSNDLVIENRKARHDYAIGETVECGMILMGSEVKSIRNGKVSLQEGFVRVEFGSLRGAPKGKASDAAVQAAIRRRISPPGLYLHGVNISEYGPAGRTGSEGQHRTTRVRTLLCHKRELEKLAREVMTKGATLVPLKIYFKNGKAKVLVAVGKSKTYQDKRESIAKRDAQRDMARAMSRRA